MAETVRRWLETIHARRVQQEFDNIVLVVGDEGVGKSNFITGLVWWWQEIRGVDRSPDSVLDQLVWSRSGMQEAMANWSKRSAIVAHDAARILHRKRAMESGQVELETDLLDVRTKEHLIILGFQGWDKVPSDLRERRAEHVIYLPKRGQVRLYHRSSLEGHESGEAWPPADAVDTFPYLGDLEGPVSDCWTAFQNLDLEQKRERLQDDETQAPDEIARREQVKTALRAVRPWEPDAGLTQREAAQLVDYSKSWVSDRVQEWKMGEHDELVDAPPA